MRPTVLALNLSGHACSEGSMEQTDLDSDFMALLESQGETGVREQLEHGPSFGNRHAAVQRWLREREADRIAINDSREVVVESFIVDKVVQRIFVWIIVFLLIAASTSLWLLLKGA